MSEKYTKGPWNANFTRFSGWVVGFHITDPKHGSLRPICEAYDKMGAMNPDEIAANARRIVACVNACEGISTENLEENRPVKWLAQQYNEVVKQRDELLEALQALMDDEAPIDEKHWNDCCDKARAAILKATGEQA